MYISLFTDAIPSRAIHHATTNNTLISEKCVVTGELTGENDIDVLGKITMPDKPVIDLKNAKTSDKKLEESQNTVNATL